MFKNVLIVEDHESASISVRKTLEEFGIRNPLPQYVYYCDDAYSRVAIALREGKAFDLLITDLFFEEDHHVQQIPDGVSLIQAVRKLQPNLKILVFSAEHRAAVIEGLFKKHNIQGYVRKARYDAQELRAAIETLSKNKKHFPIHLRKTTQHTNAHDFTAYDLTILTLLASGTLQKDIPAYLQQNQIRPSGLSSVEKRLSLMKESLGFSKNEQLVAYCKDCGLI